MMNSLIDPKIKFPNMISYYDRYMRFHNTVINLRNLKGNFTHNDNVQICKSGNQNWKTNI